MNKKPQKELIGCVAVIDNKGKLVVCPGLKAYKMPPDAKSALPEYRIIGFDEKGGVYLTSDGMFVSLFTGKITILK